MNTPSMQLNWDRTRAPHRLAVPLFPSCVDFETLLSPIRKFIERISQSFSIISMQETPLRWVPPSIWQMSQSLASQQWDESRALSIPATVGERLTCWCICGDEVCNCNLSLNLIRAKRDERVQMMFKCRNHGRPRRKHSTGMLYLYRSPSQ